MSAPSQEAMPLDSPPLGSAITVADATVNGGTEVRVLQWRPSERHPAQWILEFAGICVLLMCLTVAVAVPLTTPEPSREVYTMFCVVVGVLLCFAIVLIWLGRSIRGCETLELRPGVLHYDTGPPALPLPVILVMWPMGQNFGGWFTTGSRHPTHLLRKRYTVPVADMGRISISRVGEHQRLTIDHGADRIEIGPVLREPEREWLAAVLRQWRASQ